LGADSTDGVRHWTHKRAGLAGPLNWLDFIRGFILFLLFFIFFELSGFLLVLLFLSVGINEVDKFSVVGRLNLVES
jgi:hypothetical protein